jgi:hypothetical protein
MTECRSRHVCLVYLVFSYGSAGRLKIFFCGVSFSAAHCGLVDTPGGEPAFEFSWALNELAGLDG